MFLILIINNLQIFFKKFKPRTSTLRWKTQVVLPKNYLFRNIFSSKIKNCSGRNSKGRIVVLSKGIKHSRVYLIHDKSRV